MSGPPGTRGGRSLSAAGRLGASPVEGVGRRQSWRGHGQGARGPGARDFPDRRARPPWAGARPQACPAGGVRLGREVLASQAGGGAGKEEAALRAPGTLGGLPRGEPGPSCLTLPGPGPPGLPPPPPARKVPHTHAAPRGHWEQRVQQPGLDEGFLGQLSLGTPHLGRSHSGGGQAGAAGPGPRLVPQAFGSRIQENGGWEAAPAFGSHTASPADPAPSA